MVEVSLEEVQRYDLPVPRYTSYPTAPTWKEIDEKVYQAHLFKSRGPLSLYFHIPFCKTMCLFCACSVILNRKKENEERYVHYLEKEIALVASILGKRSVTQIHFGGGTPTQLDGAHFERLFDRLRGSFDMGGEISIEIDPRTVYLDQGEKLRHLKKIGFNRVSFGVQDLDSKVQEAIKRRQTLEMTQLAYRQARECGFSGVNIDLIYGLPFQTVQTFKKTLQEIVSMRPDRIALYSYAKVPWIKPHQKAIEEAWLPTSEEKLRIYLMAKKYFEGSGYIALGMDHFALGEDELARGLENKMLHRNFQGYTLKLAEDMVSFGLTAVGDVQNGYFQNVKELKEYYQRLDENRLPVEKGIILSDDDRRRRWVIHTLMCHFVLNKREFEEKFHCSFDPYFKTELQEAFHFEREGMLKNNSEEIEIIGKGRLFIRNIVSIFDYYFNKDGGTPLHSRAI